MTTDIFDVDKKYYPKPNRVQTSSLRRSRVNLKWKERRGSHFNVKRQSNVLVGWKIFLVFYLHISMCLVFDDSSLTLKNWKISQKQLKSKAF